MNRTTATCIAGMRSKTTSRIRIHFFAPPREGEPFAPVEPRGRSFLRGLGLGIFALPVSLIINNFPWTS